jgi:predicted component of type VI protein secretion system
VALVHRPKQRFAAGELLVEVARVQPGAGAQRLDRGRRVAIGPEQLEARVEQLLASLRASLGRALAAVAALG